MLESKRRVREWRKKQIPAENLLIDCCTGKGTIVTIAILFQTSYVVGTCVDCHDFH